MTSRSSSEESNAERLSLTQEEKEETFSRLSALIESADPSAWTGLPLPEKKPRWERFLDWIADLLS